MSGAAWQPGSLALAPVLGVWLSSYRCSPDPTQHPPMTWGLRRTSPSEGKGQGPCREDMIPEHSSSLHHEEHPRDWSPSLDTLAVAKMRSAQVTAMLLTLLLCHHQCDKLLF